MSSLRDQLELASKAYESLRYPGNLATHVLRTDGVRRELSLAHWAGLAFLVTASAVAAVALRLGAAPTPLRAPLRQPIVRQLELPPRLQFSPPTLPSIRGFGFSLSSLHAVPLFSGLRDTPHAPSPCSIPVPSFNAKPESA